MHGLNHCGTGVSDAGTDYRKTALFATVGAETVTLHPIRYTELGFIHVQNYSVMMSTSPGPVTHMLRVCVHTSLHSVRARFCIHDLFRLANDAFSCDVGYFVKLPWMLPRPVF